MKKLVYNVLMKHDPCEYDRMTNHLGQEIVFYEHPLLGDETTVIAVYHKEKIAVSTDFWETDDMIYPESDYAIIYEDSKLICRYESKDFKY